MIAGKQYQERMEETTNSTNTLYYYDRAAWGQSIRNTPEFQSKLKGRRAVKVISPSAEDVLNEAAEIGMNTHQEEVFLSYINTCDSLIFDTYDYEKKQRKEQYNSQELVELIFKEAQAFLNDRQLFLHFRDAMYEKVLEDNEHPSRKLKLEEFKKEYNSIKERNSCNSQELIKDINDFCENCPLPQYILTDIENSIIPQIEVKKDYLSKTEFSEWVKEELKSATDAMTKMIQESHRTGAFLSNISKVYVFNKERAKVLKKYLSPSIVKKGQKASSAELNLSALFKKKSLFEESIKAMRHVTIEPNIGPRKGPILNSQNQFILDDRSKVAPIWALVKALEEKSYFIDKIDRLIAYQKICEHISILPSSRPEKSEQHNIYYDFFEAFKKALLAIDE